jgi:dihydroflavonol-4-reductase
VRRLLGRGYEVTALIGSDRGLENLDDLPVTTRDFDMLDPSKVRTALGGGRALFHVAGHYSFWDPDPLQIYRTNVVGTRNVLRAAAELGYSKVVHTSSAATLVPALLDEDGTEESLFDLRRFQGHYKQSKLMAEMVALRAAAQGLPVVVVHPTTVLGEGDRRPTPTGAMIVHFLRGRMKLYAQTVLNIVDVEDVAEGHVLALERGREGHGYILGGENLAMAEITRILADLTGIPAPRFGLPHSILQVAGLLNEWISDRITGSPPLIDLESALHARVNRSFSSEKARRELSYRPAPARATLAKSVRWFIANGYADDRRLRPGVDSARRPH